MSLITCCPACGTMFKVVADQLRISEGWVRCGHCAQVFDAAAHMMPAATEAPQPMAAGVPPSMAITEPAAIEPVWEPQPEPEPEPEVAAQALPEPEPVAERRMPANTGPSGLPAEAPEFHREAAPEELPVFGEEQLEQARLDAAEADAALHEVSFMRDARRRAFWARPLVRTVLVLVVLALAAVLALQVAVQERDRLAATQPQLKPYLEQLCAQLQCTVSPPRAIESVAIDSSSFSKLRTDTYRLNFTLKNSAPIAIATPSMELTLTDTQDQAVLRRVLSPAELGAGAGLLAAGGEWNASVTLAVASAGGNGRISGYRLLAFYP